MITANVISKRGGGKLKLIIKKEHKRYTHQVKQEYIGDEVAS